MQPDQTPNLNNVVAPSGSTGSTLILEKSFYTVTEAATALNVPKRKIEASIRMGKLLVYKTPGGHRKIPKVALQELSL